MCDSYMPFIYAICKQPRGSQFIQLLVERITVDGKLENPLEKERERDWNDRHAKGRILPTTFSFSEAEVDLPTRVLMRQVVRHYGQALAGLVICKHFVG